MSTKIIIFLIAVLCTMAYWVHGQSSSNGNTTVGPNGEMVIFGAHEFDNNGLGSQTGIIGTDRTTMGLVSFADGAPQPTGMSDVQHVDGYVRKYGSGVFQFPIGDNGKYRPVSITSMTMATDHCSAAYYAANPGIAITSQLGGGNYGALPTGAPFSPNTTGTGVYNVSAQEYWDINSNRSVAVTFTFDSNSDIANITGNDLTNLIVVGWDGSEWEAITSNPATGTLSSGTISTASIVPDTYEAYTFASSQPPSEICNNGLDDNGNGDIDCDDSACMPTINNVTTTPLSCPLGTDDGIIVVDASGSGTLEYAINGGTYQSSSTFTGLSAGNYTATVRLVGATCVATYGSTVNLATPSCTENCTDGIDNDGDGDIDCDDSDCSPSIASVIESQPTCPCGSDNGSISINATGSNLEYSVNGGLSYMGVNTISDLAPGSYNIVVRNLSGGCTTTYTLNPVVLNAPNCIEINNNGIDDDCDGDVDCEDDDCKPTKPNSIIFD